MSWLEHLRAEYPDLFETLDYFKRRSPESRRFTREDPIGYSVTRKRQIRAALLSGDPEQLQAVIDDLSGVGARRTAQQMVLSEMEDIVAESQESQ